VMPYGALDVAIERNGPTAMRQGTRLNGSPLYWSAAVGMR